MLTNANGWRFIRLPEGYELDTNNGLWEGAVFFATSADKNGKYALYTYPNIKKLSGFDFVPTVKRDTIVSYGQNFQHYIYTTEQYFFFEEIGFPKTKNSILCLTDSGGQKYIYTPKSNTLKKFSKKQEKTYFRYENMQPLPDYKAFIFQVGDKKGLISFLGEVILPAKALDIQYQKVKPLDRYSEMKAGALFIKEAKKGDGYALYSYPDMLRRSDYCFKPLMIKSDTIRTFDPDTFKDLHIPVTNYYFFEKNDLDWEHTAPLFLRHLNGALYEYNPKTKTLK